MARSRNIKPSFFTNDVLAECSMAARLLFAGLWTIADREGRLEDRPKKIKAEVLPYDDCDCDALLNDLFERGFILRYAQDNNKYIQILNFAKHQNPHQKEAASTIPAPDSHQTSQVNTGTIPALTLNPLTDSPIPHPRVEDAANAAEIPELKFKSEKGMRLKAYLASNGEDKTGQELGLWAKQQGLTAEEINQELQKFQDHFNASPGQKGVKLDWPGTWRNWVRRVVNDKKQWEARNELFRQRKNFK